MGVCVWGGGMGMYPLPTYLPGVCYFVYWKIGGAECCWLWGVKNVNVKLYEYKEY